MSVGSGQPPIAQLAEAADLKSVQCRFEPDWGDHSSATRFAERNRSPPGILPAMEPARFDLAHYGWLLLVFVCVPAATGALITAAVAAGEQCRPRGDAGCWPQ